ncbi:MAG TPA: PAS domain-containing protein [Acetobacteraceae bacterium]
MSADAQAILESMGDAFYALDDAWRIVYANRRALAFWGTTAAEVIGQVIWQRFPQMVGTLNEQVLRRVRDEQRMITFEAPSPTMGVWVSVNVGPSGDGVTVYWRDISERIAAENALRNFAEKLEREVADRTRALSEVVDELRRSRTRYSAVFENSPVDLVFMSVQPDGRIVCEEANPAWEHHSGYPRAFVVGRSLEEVLPPEQAEFATMQYRRAIESRQPVEYEYTARFPIGEVARRSFLVPLPGDSGAIEHVLLTSIDLTEMRRVEAQLRQAQKMEAIGQLTGGVAHDFNNLLTAVIGNLELLQARLTDQRLIALVDAAMRSAMRGGQLTQQLLAYARRQNLSPRPVDVNAVIIGMGELLQRSLGGLVQVETDLAADLWLATSDPTQLELVVLNLAINSRDAMPNGGLLRIVTANVPEHDAARLIELDPGDYVRIAVIDTGAGMTSDVLQHAFEPFFTTKEIGKGSGLGLAQVYGVATQFGGTVRLGSDPGAGTTVEVFLPRALASQESIAPHGSHAVDLISGGGTVLVVDDDPEVREIVAIFLREAGYTVKEAGNGPQARDILAAGRISLALVDYAMPMMSGYEFVRLARTIQPDLPVIYVTGAGDALGPGKVPLSDPIVMKPYSRASLLKIVRELALPNVAAQPEA